MEEDSYAKLKYDTTAEQVGVIIGRIIELAAKHGVSMTEVSLAWLLTKVTAPVVGATKLHHIEGAAKAVDLILSEDKIAYLEEPYIPHALVGVRHRIPWRRQKRSTFGLQEAKKYREKKDGKTKTMLSKTFVVAFSHDYLTTRRQSSVCKKGQADMLILSEAVH